MPFKRREVSGLHSEEVLMRFIDEVRNLGPDFGLATSGGDTPDSSEYIELGYNRPDGYGVVLVLEPKASTEGPLTILIGRFEGTGEQRRQAVKRFFDDW